MPFRGRIDTKALGIVWRGARDVTKENYSHYSVQSVPVIITIHAAATAAGAHVRSPAGHRGLVEPRKSLHVVAARNSGRWGGAGGQAPSGPCDPCGRTVLLSRVTLFAFSVIATLPTLTRPQIP